MSTHKPYILLIEKDTNLADAMIRICAALNLEAEVMQTHSNATRAYAAKHPSAVFYDPGMKMIDPRALLEDFTGVAHARKVRPTPVIFMTDTPEDLVRLGLKGLPGTAVISKPIQVEVLYAIFNKLSLVQLDIPHPSNTARGKIETWEKFLKTSEDFASNLSSKLGG